MLRSVQNADQLMGNTNPLALIIKTLGSAQSVDIVYNHVDMLIPARTTKHLKQLHLVLSVAVREVTLRLVANTNRVRKSVKNVAVLQEITNHSVQNERRVSHVQNAVLKEVIRRPVLNSNNLNVQNVVEREVTI